MNEIARPITVVGAFARIDPADAVGVRSRREAVDGVVVMELDDPHRVGLIIEATDSKAATEILDRAATTIDGVWGVWPVSIERADDPDEIVGDT